MQLTRESPRTRWLVLFATWCLCTAFVVLHAQAVRDYIGMIDGVGLRGAPEAATPMRQVIPTRYADAQMWIRHALAGREAGELRVRFTTADNAPFGREVHWASPLMWIIRGSNALGGVEESVVWLNAPILLALVVLFSGWTAARAGAGAGVLVALAMIGHQRFYDAFAPANVDHHGLLAAAVFGLVLGLVFMGAGWWRPNLGGTFATLLPSDPASARRAAVVSALCGGLGLWISAASVLPAIAITGASGLIVALWRGGAARRDGARFDAGAWWLWGTVGALTSSACYLIEYAPGHLGLRLEVNHPLYSLAWWGGAGLVAILGGSAGEPGRRSSRSGLVGRLALPVAAVLIVPVALFAGGEKVFVLRDPFIAELRHFVLEGRSLPATARAFGFGVVAYPLLSCLLLVPAFVLGRRTRGEGAALLGFALLVAAAFMALGLWEVRWWLVGSATQIALLLVIIALTRSPWRWVLGMSLLLFLPAAFQRTAAARSAVRNSVVDERDILQPLYRDLAATLRATQPEGDIVLLATPNASTGLGYYGRFKTLGTLFWENAPGLKAAAAIFSARTDDEAARLVRERGVTHLALISSVPFYAEYFALLNPDAPAADARNTFAHRLARQRIDVPWLQPIPYRKPADLEIAQTRVLLFKVAFDQPDAERRFQTAVAHAAAGDPASADAALNELIATTPADAHATLLESAAAAFYDYGSDAAAIGAFRRALQLAPNPTATTTLAWILATSGDAPLRDGRAALALIEPLAGQEPADPTVLSAFAAALAEVGRFTDAAIQAERALDVARAAGDQGSLALLQRRLDSYRSQRPWHQ